LEEFGKIDHLLDSQPEMGEVGSEQPAGRTEEGIDFGASGVDGELFGLL